MHDDDVAAHRERIARDGYTIVEDAIEPELVDALDDDLLRLERELDVTPAQQSVRGRAHRPHLQPARARRRSTSASRCTSTCCRSSRACSTPAASSRRCRRSHRPGRDGAADPRRRSADPDPEAARRRRCATRCGRSPTSPRRTARRASSRARTCATTRPSRRALRQHPRRDAARQRARLARQPLARRRRQPHRSSAASASP